jgi:ABC-type spermidine/putrescine transport system permease subunit I
VTRRAAPYVLSAPAAFLLLGLLLGPLVLVARVSLYEPPHGRGFFTPGTWTAANFAAVTDGHGLRLLGFTALFGVGVAGLTVLVAYPLALFLRSRPPPWRRTALAAVLLPKLASVLVILFGLQRLLGDTGPVNHLLLSAGLTDGPVRLVRNAFGAVTGEVYLILPYAVLVLFLQLHAIDPGLEAAARGLGASRWQAFRRVTLPLSVPGLVVAGQLALVWGLGAFLGPLLLGGPAETTLSVEVHRQAFEYGRWPRAAAGAVLLVGLAGGCLTASTLLARLVRRRV